jgi:hypothetical protein
MGGCHADGGLRLKPLWHGNACCRPFAADRTKPGGLFVSLLTTLAGVRRTLDAVNGGLDNVLGALGLVAATVNDVDA